MADVVPHFEELAVHRAQLRSMQREIDTLMVRMIHVEEKLIELRGRRRMLISVGFILLALGNLFAWSWSCGSAFHISF